MKWNEYWFREGGLLSLAMLRIGTCLGLLFGWFIFAIPDYDIFFQIVDTQKYHPISLLAVLGPTPPSAAFFEVLKPISLFAIVLGMLGLGTRVVLPVAFLSTLLPASLLYSFGLPWSHHYNLPLLSLGILCFAPCGDALSLDKLILKRWFPARFEALQNKEDPYAWAVLLVQLTAGLFFFNAAYWKVAQHSAWIPWAFSDNLRLILADQWYFVHNGPYWWHEIIMQNRWLYRTMAAANIVFQMLPLGAAIFSRRPRLRILFGCVFLAELLGLGIIMGIWFLPYFPLFTVFVDWDYFVGGKPSALTKNEGPL